MTLQLDDIVQVKSQITRAAPRREFGQVLFLTKDATLDAYGAGKVRTFGGMRDVSVVFAQDSEPYRAAQIYFQQVPYPKDLLIGRWDAADKPSTYTSAGTVGTLATIQALATPSTYTGTGTVGTLAAIQALATPSTYTGTGTVDTLTNIQALTAATLTWGTVSLTGLDFSSATTLSGAALILETAIRAADTQYANATVAYSTSASQFVITAPLNSGQPVTLTASMSGTAAATLGLDTGTVVDGAAATLTWGSVSLTGLDFSSATTLSGAALILETAIRAADTQYANATVAYSTSASQFVITAPLNSGQPVTLTASMSGTAAATLGLDTGTVVDGAAATLTWGSVSLTGLDFSSATTLSGAALILETALRAQGTQYDEATVSYFATGSRRIVISVPLNDGEPVDLPATMGGTAAATLGLDGGTVITGETGETLAEAMSTIRAVNDEWYFICGDSDVDPAALASWGASSEDRMAGVNIVSDIDSLPSLSAHERVYALWSGTADYKALSLAGRFSSVDFQRANSLITAKFQRLPGTEPDTLTLDDKNSLDDADFNYYTRFGPEPIVAEGRTLDSGVWIDVRYWLDWIVDEIRRAVYGLLAGSTSRIPQTPPGLASITSVIERACERGRRNGGIAPGRVSESLASDIRRATGSDFDGFLSRGYLVVVGSIFNQSQSDREARVAPPFRVYLKGSGAVHNASIELVFEG